jgi:hypothetical protein
MCEVWEAGRCKAEPQADWIVSCLEAQQDGLGVAHAAEAVCFIAVDAWKRETWLF